MGLGSRATQAIAIVAVLACSEGKPTVNVADVEGGVPWPTYTDGGILADAGASKVGPIVTVMSPPASTDPAAGPVLSGPSVDVKCNVVQRDKTGPVDPTKVAIWVYAASMIDPVLKVPAVLQGTDTFGASVALDLVPTGGVRFRCLAADTAMISQTGYGDVITFYDAGPNITFTNLNADSIVQRGTDRSIDLAVQFKVEAAPLSAGDTAADVAAVTLNLSGIDIVMPVSPDGTYKKEVDFYDLFNKMPIDSVTIAVTASNKRGTPPVAAKKQLIVKVDGAGPDITVTSPALINGVAAPIVGGTVRMDMTITDALSGVGQGADKVYAIIPYAGVEKNYAVTAGDKGTYFFTFEAGEFKGVGTIYAQIHAFDKAGNKSVADFTMHLDTVAPYLSLDPRNVRECVSTANTCSASFDPLGLAPGEGQVVDKAAHFRALIWERGISVPGGEQWIAGVRDETVAFYAQQDPETPLLIDTDKDGYCDAINNASVLGAKVPFVTKLNPVQIGGGLPISPGSLTDDPAAPVGFLALTSPPTPKCAQSDMTYALSHLMPGTPPVIYASETASLCTGVAIVLPSRGGWTCVAAAARDRAGATGNLGISTPLHVCVNINAGDCEKAVGEIAPVPTMKCTDGCQLPADALVEPYERVFVR
jgi:hypothetical protein